MTASLLVPDWVPDWVPAADGFWGPPTADGLSASAADVRQGWLLRHLPDSATQALFAADCAATVLPQFSAVSPADRRPGDAISAGRRIAFGVGAARAAAEAAWASEEAAEAAEAAWAAAGGRLDQARALWLFVPPAAPALSEDVRGLAGGAVDAFFRGESMAPHLHRLADAWQEAGNPYDARCRMWQERPERVAVGMYPLTPAVTR